MRGAASRYVWYDQPDGDPAIIIRAEHKLTIDEVAAIVAFIRIEYQVDPSVLTPFQLRERVKRALFVEGDDVRGRVGEAVTPYDWHDAARAFGDPT